MTPCACKIDTARYRKDGEVRTAPIVYTCAEHRKTQSKRDLALRIWLARWYPNMALALPAPREVA